MVSTPRPPRTALVLGSDTRSFLAVVRSLGRQGVQVHVAPYDFSSAALSSRYIRGVHRLPPLQADPEEWIVALLALCERIAPDVVFPCDDRGIIPLHHFRQRLGALRVALPGPEALAAFFDKHQTRQLAAQCGVPTAPGRLLDPDDTADTLASEFGFPLYLKPCSSYELSSIESRQNVIACKSSRQLRQALSTIGRHQRFLVEAHSAGTGVGLSVLCHDGEVSHAFQHRRVREPVGGGGSSYRRSEAVSADLEQMTRALCRAAKLEGVAMFEYRVDDATGRKILLEVNARFWGSLPLAVAAGVDFPALWFQQLTSSAPLPRQAAYRVPFHARNLLADLYSTAGHASSAHPGSRFRQLLHMVVWAGSLWRLPLGRESLDTLAFDDPQPAGREFAQIMRKLAGRIRHVVPALDARHRHRLRLQVREACLSARREQRPLRLLVACFGNICRSPFAHRLLEQRFKDSKQSVQIMGAALACRPGRPSPARAIAVASEWQVDLSEHRSVYATEEMLAAADLVLVFDGANLELLASRGAPLRHGVWRLGELTMSGAVDIVDPVDGDEAFFRRVYGAIAGAVDELQAVVEAP